MKRFDHGGPPYLEWQRFGPNHMRDGSRLRVPHTARALAGRPIPSSGSFHDPDNLTACHRGIG